MPAFQFRDPKPIMAQDHRVRSGTVVAPNLPRIAEPDQVYAAIFVRK